MPEKIREIIQRKLGGTEIDDIQLVEKYRKKVYKVDAEFPYGREFKLDITEDRTIVKKQIEKI